MVVPFILMAESVQGHSHDSVWPLQFCRNPDFVFINFASQFHSFVKLKLFIAKSAPGKRRDIFRRETTAKNMGSNSYNCTGVEHAVNVIFAVIGNHQSALL